VNLKIDQNLISKYSWPYLEHYHKEDLVKKKLGIRLGIVGILLIALGIISSTYCNAGFPVHGTIFAFVAGLSISVAAMIIHLSKKEVQWTDFIE